MHMLIQSHTWYFYGLFTLLLYEGLFLVKIQWCNFIINAGSWLGGGGGGGVLCYFHILQLRTFFGVQNFEFLYFWGFSQKMNIFGGYEILWIFFWCHHKIGLVLGVISMHFKFLS